MDQVAIIDAALTKAGGTASVAREFGVTTECVRLWRARGHVPANRVIDLERITGVPRELLRPDLYARTQ